MSKIVIIDVSPSPPHIHGRKILSIENRLHKSIIHKFFKPADGWFMRFHPAPQQQQQEKCEFFNNDKSCLFTQFLFQIIFLKKNTKNKNRCHAYVNSRL